MTIQEIEQKLNECQKALAELKESKKEGKWKPKEGERYYFRDVGGATTSYNWTNSDIDKLIFEHTLTFPTYEQCERYWHFMDTVKEKSYEFSKEEWEGDSFKYRINYDYLNGKMYTEGGYYVRTLGEIYFKTHEDAQYIIDNFKDELMEYWI